MNKNNNKHMSSVLIIEDEGEVRGVVSEIFKQEPGFKVAETSNGKDGFRLVKSARPDVVLLDIKLAAQTDGVEVLKQIREAKISTKVVVMTGYADAEMEQQIKALGVEAFVEKPFEPPEIIRVVRKVMDQKRKCCRG